MLVTEKLSLDAEWLSAEDLFRHRHALVWRAVLAQTAGRREIADEAVAEAFARAVRYWPTIRDPERWVFRVAFRVARAELRRARSTGQLPQSQPEAISTESVPSTEFYTQLRALSQEARTAIFLHYYADLPAREVAALTGSSVGAVKVRLFRARRDLRRLLDEQERS